MLRSHDLARNSVQRQEGFVQEFLHLRHEIPDMQIGVLSKFRILRVQLKIWPRLLGKSDRLPDGCIRNCFREESA